jgi:hypothetical protein
MVGHASAAMTLDAHADQFDDDVHAVSTALSRQDAQRVRAERSRDGCRGGWKQ